jgi:hypothetical protein
MKIILTLIIWLVVSSAFAQGTSNKVSLKIKVSQLYSLLDQEISKRGPTPRLLKTVVGDWFETNNQPQVYPGGCTEIDGYYTDSREIKLGFDKPLKKSFSFTTRRDGATYLDYPRFRTDVGGYGGYVAEFEGNTVKTVDGNCVITNLGEVKEVMICAPYSKQSMCSWYSFFLKN